MTFRTVLIVVVALLSVVPLAIVFNVIVLWLIVAFQPKSIIHVPFPADEPITEAVAVELSKRALLRDGKQAPNMRPVSWGATRRDADGREIVFMKQNDGSDAGTVLWWMGSPKKTWDYSVFLEREGDSVKCIIVTPL